MGQYKIRAFFAGLCALALVGCESVSDLNTQGNNAPTYQGFVGQNAVATGAKHYAAGNFGLAEKSFRSAVEATPANSRAWLGLAASYDQLGRYELADRAYAHLLKEEGRKASILNNQAYSYILRGEMNKARPLLHEAQALSPDNAIINGNLTLANS
ncbi:MAG: tetratricopeptide repeat protein [Pseudomonadota bacterium]